MNKKGQAIEQLQSIIVPLIAIGIVLVIGFLIMSEAKEKVVDIQGSDWCVLDTTARNYTPWSLDRTDGGAICFNSSVCIAGHTLNYTTGGCCNNTGVSAGEPDCINAENISTVFTSGTDADNQSAAKLSHAWNGTGETQSAMSDIPGWLAIIVITVIGAVLIGLVAMFRRQ